MRIVHEISNQFSSLGENRVVIQEVVFQLSAVPVSQNNPYVHDQFTPSQLWIVNHNLGYVPFIEVMSVGGVVVEAEILHVTSNQAQINFNTPQTGKALAR